MRKSRQVMVVSLGCPKNWVDTEVMCGQLATAGFTLTNQADAADVMLINTCAFIAEARAEAHEEIEAALDWKQRRRGRKVVVAGCLPQRDPDAVADEFPGADLLLALDDVPFAAERIRTLFAQPRKRRQLHPHLPAYVYDHESPRLLLTPHNYAYAKIAEGCDHKCSFCTIPSIRGRQRSRPVDSIVTECEHLLRQGVRELNLIAQDTTRYGHDRDDGATLAELLTRCDRLEGDFWLRLMYAHPLHVTPELLDLPAAAEHIVPYIDMPLQHISDSLLRSMGRGMDAAATRRLVSRIRESWPDAAVRTTFLVGYPGESDTDFEELFAFAADCRFERLGVFTFSAEDGTRAARVRRGLVPPEIALQRRDRLLALQQEISLERNRGLIDATVTVLVEGAEDGDTFLGRTAADAPDIDNSVHFSGPPDCVQHGFVSVRITAASAYDLYGQVIEP